MPVLGVSAVSELCSSTDYESKCGDLQDLKVFACMCAFEKKLVCMCECECVRLLVSVCIVNTSMCSVDSTTLNVRCGVLMHISVSQA